ncbi:hypothetical protein CLV99_3435 [Sphingobacterium yanglingense]|uniref:Uncharacterized protein n=1 Tax=Sphingobacterium yanglingense TaxID=1437280 RepID=A0A4R6W998_9SPHI|nr:hypothetical protein CLV99_3435 [Sphingobacterium yanglingense]
MGVDSVKDRESLSKHWRSSEVGVEVFGKMVSFGINRVCSIVELLKKRNFNNSKYGFNERTLKNNIEELNLRVVFVVVFVFFLGKIVRVNVCYNFTLRGYLFVHKDYSTDDNDRHPPR